jgi:hypothetical protein
MIDKNSGILPLDVLAGHSLEGFYIQTFIGIFFYFHWFK